MARALVVLLLLSAVALSAANQCPSNGGCPASSGSCSNCRNCQLTCSCTPDDKPTCPKNTCGTITKDDGCGSTVSNTCQCDSGYSCVSGNKCCENSCTTYVGNTQLTGQCFQKDQQPANYIKGTTSCSSGCGECYVSSFNPALCGAQANGQCGNNGGKCGCFVTNNGASCKADNFVSPVPSPLPGNGGGCQENLCNALAAKNGASAACCPVGC